jgi:hypothetical protein
VLCIVVKLVLGLILNGVIGSVVDERLERFLVELVSIEEGIHGVKEYSSIG